MIRYILDFLVLIGIVVVAAWTIFMIVMSIWLLAEYFEGSADE